MRQTKPKVMKLLTFMAMTLLMGLAGCVGGYGSVDVGPEWDGVVVVGGGYDRGDNREYHPQAFHNDGGPRRPAVASARGMASMGGHAGGHAPSGGGHR